MENRTRGLGLAITLTVLGVLVLSLGAAGALAQDGATPAGSSLNGTYDLNVSTSGGGGYKTTISVEDLGNGKVEVVGSYSGIPIVLIGDASGDVAAGGMTANFDVDVPQLFKGQATATIAGKDGKFAIKGRGSGTYYLGGGGQGSGTATGTRSSTDLMTPGVPAPLTAVGKAMSAVAPSQGFPTPSPFKTALGGGLVGLAGLLSAGASVFARRI